MVQSNGHGPSLVSYEKISAAVIVAVPQHKMETHNAWAIGISPSTWLLLHLTLSVRRNQAKPALLSPRRDQFAIGAVPNLHFTGLASGQYASTITGHSECEQKLASDGATRHLSVIKVVNTHIAVDASDGNFHSFVEKINGSQLVRNSPDGT